MIDPFALLVGIFVPVGLCGVVGCFLAASAPLDRHTKMLCDCYRSGDYS